jgi:hypothetical protein
MYINQLLLFSVISYILLLNQFVKCINLNKMFINMTSKLSELNANHSTIKYTHNEEKLLKHLFKDYNPNIMPKEFSNDTVKLYIGLAMVQLINIVYLLFIYFFHYYDNKI